MKPNVRACLAYIAWRVVSKKHNPIIFDYSQSRRIIMTGTIQTDRIDVYDHDQGCHISGKGSRGRFSLYHYGDGHSISLRIHEHQFDGYDDGSGTHFSGLVKGDSIEFYDHGEGSYCVYSI